jgi:DNA mismatch repair protein MSH5
MDDTAAVSNLTPSSSSLRSSASLIWLFHQDENCYFKNRVAMELDRTLGDVKGDITDRERSILYPLEDQILEFECDLLQVGISISILDAFISLGEIAFQFKLTCPQMVEEAAVAIKNGRHLLQELAVENFVPNDTLLSAAQPVAIVSGANGSGKSIYLKQIGLIVYLAHIGSYVPCDKAVIGITDRIFTRIVSEETVSDSNSTFSLDLKQMSKILHHHSSKSLCLIDEFGKGTAPVDGMSLLAACIKFIVENNIKAVFALHFTEIFEDSIFSAEIHRAINCFRMETIAEAANPAEGEDASPVDDNTKFIPLYKLKYGINKSSHGFSCAKNNGVPGAVLKRAQEIKTSILNKRPLQPVALTDNLSNLLTPAEKEKLKIIFLQARDKK